MRDLLFSIVMFFIIYLFYLFFVILRKKKLEKFKNNTYVTYLVNAYNLDLKKIDIKVLAHIIALTNAFILSSALFIISFIKSLFFKMLLGFVILIPVQFFMYHIIGKMYKKSGQTIEKRSKK